jgi:hypothetical protein
VTVDRIGQDDAHRHGHAMLSRLRNCDVVFYTRTHNATALGPQWSDVWQQLKQAGVVTCSLHLDRFWDLEREHLITQPNPDALFTTEFVWTADGGDHPWAKHGINHRWLVPAVDRAEATEPRTHGWEGHDVVFVGSVEAYRGHPAYYDTRRALVDHLQRTYGDRFAHYGYGGRPVVRQQDLTDLYRAAKVVVGDSCFANSRPDGVTNRDYWSDRIPETLGRGGFLLHPWVPGLRAAYAGAPLALYIPGDWDDLDAQIGAFLASPGARAGVVERCRETILREHTWTVRMREVLDEMGLSERLEEVG